MKKEYDSVNYDYPQCGGYEVYHLSGDKYSIREYSNYSGRHTGRYYRINTKNNNWSDERIKYLIQQSNTRITRYGTIVS